MSRFVRLDELSFAVQLLADELLLLRPHDGRSDPRLPRWGKAILDARLDFITDVIATPQEICLRVNRRYSPASLSQLASLRLSAAAAPRRWRLPCQFFGSHAACDWTRIEQHTGLERATYQQRLIEPTYSIAMLGFLPGFLYLGGLPTDMHCPRLDHPVRSVPAGTLAVGGPYVGVYGRSSPAGWNVVGEVAIRTLETTAWPPVDYLPGDEVVLERLEPDEFQQLKDEALSWRAYHGRG